MKLRALLTTGTLTAAVVFGISAPQTYAGPLSYNDDSKKVVITGEVVRYEPGRVLVLRSDGREMTYNLTPTVVVPAEVATGRVVSVQLDSQGGTTVERVTTTSVTPEGQVKRTTEETRTHPDGSSTKTTTVTVSGEVAAYVPGSSITVMKPDRTKVTYVIRPGTTLPEGLAIGKVVTVRGADGSVQTIVIERQ